jgi:hypothetical protein
MVFGATASSSIDAVRGQRDVITAAIDVVWSDV